MADTCFQIKGTNITTMVLDLYRFSAEQFTRELQDKIASAPQFFYNSTIYLDLGAFIGELSADDLAIIVARCRELNLQPIACKGASDALLPAMQHLGLALLPPSRARKTDLPCEPQPLAAEPLAQTTYRPSTLITKPVRSGQQVYAEGADLIVLAPVSEGAEIIADGHIHVYASLRGRALAGVKDDLSARIFCQKMEAELVSIAGQFILNDTLREHCWKKPAQVFLDNNTIQVSAL